MSQDGQRLAGAIARCWDVLSAPRPQKPGRDEYGASRLRFLASDVRLIVGELSRRMSAEARARSLPQVQEQQVRQDCACDGATPGSLSPATGVSDADPAA